MIRLFAPLVAWLLLAPLGAAQLDLPDQMRGSKKERATSGGKKGDLVLPRKRSTGEEGEEAPAEPAPSPETAGAPAVSTERAAAIVDELAGTGSYDADRSRALAAQLETLADSGLRAARACLPLETTAAVATSSRVLLRAGDEADRQRLWTRLTGKLPASAPSALLEAIAESEPTFLDDARLVELLDHPQTAMRSSAARRLAERTRPALLPSLMPALDSTRTDTRLRALDLVAGVDDPSATAMMLARLEDDSARVAYRAAELLAASDDEGVVEPLLERVRGTSRLFRDGAYALITIVEREDRFGRGILDLSSVPLLLEGLRQTNPFVRGASAVALAGIGFRSTDTEATAWLDRDVPSQLVAAIVGDEFHADFSALLRPARRRLSLISGERFGADGPAWARWWVENAETFRARRASIDVQPGDEMTLTLALRGTSGGRDAFVLVGPGAVEPDDMLGEMLYVGTDEAAALVRQLGALGVFGVERLPGHYGGGGAVRTLEVQIADQRKRFTFGDDSRESWFDDLSERALEVRERNRWQRYYDPARFATRRAFWDEERDWWIEPREPQERQRRVLELLLGALDGSRSGERDAMVEELSMLARESGVLGLGDSARLASILSSELFFGDRARTLLDLTLESLADTPTGLVDPAAARNLFDDVYDLFRETALDGLEQILASTDGSLAAELATDPRPAARSVAGRRLATLGGTREIELLRELLDDEIEVVQASTVEAIGRAGLDALSTEVLIRARIGTQGVRTAALRAAGRIGGEGAREAMLASLGSGDAALQRAAVEGLAELRDPSTAALLVSFLRRGPEAPLYAPARRGLLALGERAWPELRRLAIAERMDTRREAGLLLAEQGAAEAVPILLQVLLDQPDDSRVAQELAILTCVDFRGDAEPARSWTAWWDNAVQDGSLAWFRGAQERAGLDAAPLGSLEGAGTREGAESLLDTLVLDGQPLVAQRAERELSRLLGRALERPADPSLELDWRALLRQEIARRFP